MTEERQDPSNEQLANFLAVYASSNYRFASLKVSPAILEHIFDNNEEQRQVALRIHHRFKARIDEMIRKTQAGELPCQYIRSNGKQCPNYNRPGSLFCGLHQDEEEA